REVAEPLHERVGAVLLEEAGGLAFEDRLLIHGLGLLAPLDLSAYDLLAHPNGVPKDGPIGRQRHGVDHLERIVVRVCEFLSERRAREAALGARLDLSGLER